MHVPEVNKDKFQVVRTSINQTGRDVNMQYKGGLNTACKYSDGSFFT